MVNVCYTQMPTKDQIGEFAVAAFGLRKAMKRLAVRCTPWGHIWSVHVPRSGTHRRMGSCPQFLAQWGTMFPFLCHGVEGKHRWFKHDLRCSTGNQWKKGKVGFAHVLDLDWVEWELRGLSERWVRRVVPRTKADTRVYKLAIAYIGKGAYYNRSCMVSMGDSHECWTTQSRP